MMVEYEPVKSGDDGGWKVAMTVALEVSDADKPESDEWLRDFGLWEERTWEWEGKGLL